jgi:hypothetical protein
MPYKVVLLKCKTDGETFELGDHQPVDDPKFPTRILQKSVMLPLEIRSCPHCNQPHTYTSADEVNEVIVRDFESDPSSV